MTPFGEIEVSIDGTPVEYTAVDCAYNMQRYPDLSGCFFIKIEFKPDGKDHFITCCIKNCISDEEGDIDSGECLELQNFWHDKAKISIGTEGEVKWEYSSDYYDYDIDYLRYGMGYHILPETTKWEKFVFGVAWMDEWTDDNEYYTWYGADPSLLREREEREEREKS